MSSDPLGGSILVEEVEGGTMLRFRPDLFLTCGSSSGTHHILKRGRKILKRQGWASTILGVEVQSFVRAEDEGKVPGALDTL